MFLFVTEHHADSSGHQPVVVRWPNGRIDCSGAYFPVPSCFEECGRRHLVILERQTKTPRVIEAFHGGEVTECRQRVSRRRAGSRRSRIAFRTIDRVSNQFIGLSRARDCLGATVKLHDSI
jgi:hypothetical protein